MNHLLSSDLFSLLALPLMIFFFRIADVSVGTLRIIFVSRGNKLAAPLLGFVEVLLWLMAIGRIMQNLSDVTAYLAYASGFATGNFVGLWIEQKLAVGLLAMRIFTRRDTGPLVLSLRQAGYRVIVLEGQGNKGRVNVLFTIFRRRSLRHIVRIVREHNPNASYTIEEIKSVSEPINPVPSLRRAMPGPLRAVRKAR